VDHATSRHTDAGELRGGLGAVGAPRTRDELAAAVRADVLEGGAALGAERALVAANDGGAVGSEAGAAALAHGSHLESQGPLRMTEA
jgi:hypothetical protein